ncbi:histone-lysine N-methyltransferase SUVR3 isoform X4 [Physcomitrium patens]|uniref:histone-lysine N-methyltransferase SUVR3 isoform X4 n=1 Tax=Physcomitrium patens TaxID=3218 RepID=UPI000D1709F2|nr:histone-lysine N-methyltransferase SUVR3-like isoform X4 [Physcomitrium patens]|eukprot:XP_024402689.1 histone-lysine N-methyltransferase SUVR3-like isoform X4 [Physcomitrella patens]
MKRNICGGDGISLGKEAGTKILELVMAWLRPQELANLACVSQFMATAVRNLTHRRMADAAQGLERWPVPNHGDGKHVISDDTNSTCACGFTSDGVNAYTHESKMQLVDKRSNGTDASKNRIDSKSIFSNEVSLKANDASENMTFWTEWKSLELSDDDSGVNEEPPLVLECGGACICSADCCHRVTQQGLSARVVVTRQRFTGWGLHAAQHISKGSFVCEYAGELLTTVQSRERQSLYDAGNTSCGSALLVVREYMPSGEACVRINVDATKVGNVARFINHACDGGNLLPCLVRASGSVIPRLALFARQDIHDGEELRYSYGSCGGVAGKVLPCYCGTPACFGTLPSEST